MRCIAFALVAALATTTTSVSAYGEAGAALARAKNGTKLAKFDFVAEKKAALIDELKNKTEAAHAAKFTILDELESIVKAGAKPTPCQIKNITLAKLDMLKGRRLSQTGGEALIGCVDFGEAL